MMLPSPITVPIAFVKGMVSGFEARGHSVDSVLVQAGIPPELLLQPGARVSAHCYVALFTQLIAHFDDECLGFMSRPLRRGSLALMTRHGIAGPTLEAAMRRIAHIFRLLQDDVDLALVRDGALMGLVLRFQSPSCGQLPFVHELLLRVFWRLLAWLGAARLPIARCAFAFKRPLYAAHYDKVFPAPLRFACATSAIWFEANVLERPMRRDEGALLAFLAEAPARIVLPGPTDDPISAKVRRHLHQSQPEWPNLDTTADALHVSPSTLQRRLAREGASYQFLKDELRRDAAITRLSNSSVPLSTLAFDLGFADSAAFQRAFKSWTGTAPGSYRNNR